VHRRVDVLAQVQAEAAATWRSPSDGKPTTLLPGRLARLVGEPARGRIPSEVDCKATGHA